MQCIETGAIRILYASGTHTAREGILLEHEVAFLFELSGQSPGVAQGLTPEVFRIGSDMENDLIMKDQGIALYQAEISLQSQKFVIRNFSVEGSVFLNGEVFEEATLRRGDILTLGDSMFRFVTRGEALTQEELWRPVGGRKTLTKSGFSPMNRLPFLGLLSLLAVGVVIWISISQGPKNDPLSTSLDGGDPVNTVMRTDPKAMSYLYNHGVDLLAARHWDQAVIVFERVRKDSPKYREVDRLYQQGLDESRSALQLNQGKGFSIEGALSLAKEQLLRVPETSVFYREAEKLIRDIDQKLLLAQIDRVRKLMAEKDWMTARGEVESILRKDPKNEEALDLLKQIARMEGSPRKNWYFSRRKSVPETDLTETPAAKPTPEDAKPVVAKKTTGPAPAGKPSRTAPAVRKPAAVRGSPSLRRAVTAYVKGDTDRSFSELERILKRGARGETSQKAREMQRNLRAAKSYFHQAETLQNGGRFWEALEVWEKFLAKDRDLAGKAQSAYFRKASAQLSQIYYQRGKDAFDADQIVQASRFWRMAQRIDPGNKDVKQGLRRLTESAQRFYREGYSLQVVNPPGAREKWEVVLQIVPPGDPYYKKAKSQIERSAAIP